MLGALLPLLLLLPLLTALHLPTYDTAALHDLAAAERALIQLLSADLENSGTWDKDEAGKEELQYFLEFLQAETGYRSRDQLSANHRTGYGSREQPAYTDTVAQYLTHPNNRFKLVERYIYDWGQLGDYLQQIHAGISVSEHFKRSCGSLPTAEDLKQTVVELNAIISLYNIEYGDVRSGKGFAEYPAAGAGSNTAALNSGNLLILTQLSHEVGHISHCVRWADMTDRALLTSPEPATIPGEKHWLEFYLIYLECLVRLGGSSKIKQREVEQEILTHYSNNANVQAKVKHISSLPTAHSDDSVARLMRRCKVAGVTHCASSTTHTCTVQHYHYSTSLHTLHCTHYSLYYNLANHLGAVQEGDVLLYNKGAVERVVVVGAETVFLQQGAGLVLKETKLKHARICPLKVGVDMLLIYSV